MVLQDVEKLCWPKQLLMNVKLTSSVWRAQNCSLCGLVKVKPMFEKFLTRPDNQLHVSSSLMSLIPLLLRSIFVLRIHAGQVELNYVAGLKGIVWFCCQICRWFKEIMLHDVFPMSKLVFPRNVLKYHQRMLRAPGRLRQTHQNIVSQENSAPPFPSFFSSLYFTLIIEMTNNIK